MALLEWYPQSLTSLRGERYRPCHFGVIFAAVETRRVQSQMRSCWELTSGTEQLPSDVSRFLSPPNRLPGNRSVLILCRIISRPGDNGGIGRSRHRSPVYPAVRSYNQCPFFFAHFRAMVPCTLKGATHCIRHADGPNEISSYVDIFDFCGSRHRHYIHTHAHAHTHLLKVCVYVYQGRIMQMVIWKAIVSINYFFTENVVLLFDKAGLTLRFIQQLIF